MSDHITSRALLGVAIVAAVLLVAATLVVDALLGSPATHWQGLAAAQEADSNPLSDETGVRPYDAGRTDGEVASSQEETESTYLAYHDASEEDEDTHDPRDGNPDDSKTPSDDPLDADDPDDPGGANDPGTPSIPDTPDTPGTPANPGDAPARAVWVWGVVQTESGTPVSGVRVRIQGTETSATTGASGIFVLSGLAPGTSVRMRVDLGGLPWRAVGPPTREVELPWNGGVRVDIPVAPRGRASEDREEERERGRGRERDHGRAPRG